MRCYLSTSNLRFQISKFKLARDLELFKERLARLLLFSVLLGLLLLLLV